MHPEHDVFKHGHGAEKLNILECPDQPFGSEFLGRE